MQSSGTCSQCGEVLPVGARWCPICHANAANAGVGRLASPGRRLGAFALDVAIPSVAILAMTGAAFATGDGNSGLGLFMLLFLGYLGWALVLFSKGTTPGKKVLGMRVVSESGKGVGFGTMLVREWIGKWISGLVFGLGYLWILFDRERQGWHDKLLNTYVVQAG